MTVKAARRAALGLVVGFGLMTASAVARGDDAQALETHRRLWEQAAINAYVYAYQKYCECHPETPPETYVTVRGAKVVDVRHQPYGFDHYVPAEPRNFEWYWTIDDLFDLVGHALERGSVVRVDFDSTLGFPTHVFIDHDADLIGDEVDVRVTKLERLEE
ncbi:MAG TPA: DUF6174 domain-containing protein [Gammaproteobacteria bacterium]